MNTNYHYYKKKRSILVIYIELTIKCVQLDEFKHRNVSKFKINIYVYLENRQIEMFKALLNYILKKY